MSPKPYFGLSAFFSGADRSFFTAGSVIFAGSFVVNVLNYVFTLLMGRLLSVEDFGEVAAILSLFLIVSVPATALTMFMSREAASRLSEGNSSIKYVFYVLRPHVFVFSVALWIIFLLLTPVFSKLLHIHTLPFIIFSFLVPVTLAAALQSGTLQGMHKFFLLSQQSVLSTLVKLALGVGLVLLGLTVSGVVFALVVAAVVSWVFGFIVTHKLLKKETETEVLTSRIPTTFYAIVPIFVTTLFLALLSNIDVLLAKHFLTPALAGEYGALSTVGKILLYGSGAFITALLPFASAAYAEGRGREHRILALSLAIISAASAAAWAFFSMFPGFVVSLLFGASYLNIAPYLGTFAIAISCMALSIVFINYFVAVRNTSFMYFLGAGILIEIALIIWNHGTIQNITNMFVISSVALLALLIANYFLTIFIPKTRSI